MPLLQVAFFVNSGSEANDLAMKMARLYSGNYDFLALRNGYHGKRGLNAHSTWRYNMPQVEPPPFCTQSSETAQHGDRGPAALYAPPDCGPV